MLNYGGDSGDITGSVEGRRNRSRTARRSRCRPSRRTRPKFKSATRPCRWRTGQIASAGERAILGRLQDRRKELDDRSHELEMRESLLKATEKRLDAKVAELKDLETRVNTAMGNRDKAEAQRFKSIVTMYENMKSKDAARILERLDMKILVEVSTAIKPAKMSEILAQMPPEAAERLTAELARRADGKSAKSGPTAEDRKQAQRLSLSFAVRPAPGKSATVNATLNAEL